MNTYDDTEATRYNIPDDEATELNDSYYDQDQQTPPPYYPEEESEEQPQAPAKKRSIAKQAAVAAGGGLLVGAVIPPLMGMRNPDGNEDPTDPKPEGGNHSEVLTNPEWVDDNIMVATTVGEDMSFREAFATARAEVGPGGCFEWHGNVYGTYTAEEWNALSPTEQADWNNHFSWNHIDTSRSNSHHSSDATHGSEHNHTSQTTTPPADDTADDGSESDDDIEIISVNHESNDPESETDSTQTDDWHDESAMHPYVPDPEPEVEIIGVVHDPGTDANIGAVTIDGQEVILIDVDSDMTFDFMAADSNGNGEIDSNEVVDISEQNLTVNDLGGFTDSYGMAGEDSSAWDENNDAYMS